MKGNEDPFRLGDSVLELVVKTEQKYSYYIIENLSFGLIMHVYALYHCAVKVVATSQSWLFLWLLMNNHNFSAIQFSFAK